MSEDVIRVGSPLRDAAVDPMPGDASVPTNAGRADPHGPLVVAPQALTRQAQAAARGDQLPPEVEPWR